MTIGDRVDVLGFVTQYKFLARRSLREIEDLLGFQSGRLVRGATFATLDRLPRIEEFETAGYSQVAGHRHVMPPDLDPIGLRKMAMSVWTTTGPDRLINVFATTRHDPSKSNDEQYPPGLGIPQWKIVAPVPGTIVAEYPGYGTVFELR